MELNGYVYDKDRIAESKEYCRCEDRTCKDGMAVKGINPVKTTQILPSPLLIEFSRLST